MQGPLSFFLLLKCAETKVPIAHKMLWCSCAGCTPAVGSREETAGGAVSPVLSQPRHVFLPSVCLHVSHGEFIYYLAHQCSLKNSKKPCITSL